MTSDPSLRYALAVDLDETLVRTDTLHEAVLRTLMQTPLALFEMLSALRVGKTAFKSVVARKQIVPADSLIYNQSVLDLITQARADGREVVLVSASDQQQVSAIADHLGLFDAAFGTGSADTDGDNLSGARKAAFLKDRYGAGQYDYVGDAAVDIPVWQDARTAYAVNPSAELGAKADAAGINLSAVIDDTPSNWRTYVKALRPHQWVKNVLVFLPMLTAQQLDVFSYALIAFVLFSMTASSVYIFNDLADLPSDRAHPRKCRRPFAAGQISIKHGILMGVGLLLASFVVSLLVMPLIFTAVLVFYFAVTAAYSFVLKRKMMVDVITLAGLYTLRIIAGGAATGITPSPWLLAFSVFLFYALAAIKRQGELVDQARNNKDSTPGRGYLSSDVTVLQIIAISAGQAAVLIFALYLYSPGVRDLYATPEILWLICPVLLYWLSRIAVLTHRGEMDDDPIIFAARDRISHLTLGTVFAIVLCAELWG